MPRCDIGKRPSPGHWRCSTRFGHLRDEGLGGPACALSRRRSNRVGSRRQPGLERRRADGDPVVSRRRVVRNERRRDRGAGRQRGRRFGRRPGTPRKRGDLHPERLGAHLPRRSRLADHGPTRRSTTRAPRTRSTVWTWGSRHTRANSGSTAARRAVRCSPGCGGARARRAGGQDGRPENHWCRLALAADVDAAGQQQHQQHDDEYPGPDRHVPPLPLLCRQRLRRHPEVPAIR